MTTNERSAQIARALVEELGSQTAAAKLFGVAQPSISEWVKVGMSKTRENDLRFRFPKLKTWKRFPPFGN